MLGVCYCFNHIHPMVEAYLLRIDPSPGTCVVLPSGSRQPVCDSLGVEEARWSIQLEIWESLEMGVYPNSWMVYSGRLENGW